MESDLSDLESKVSELLRQHRPDARFAQALRNDLQKSKIFELRRSLGAILVACFGALFAGVLSASIIFLALKSRRRLTS